MAAVDLVLRRSSRIAQHPNHHHHHTTKPRPDNNPELLLQEEGDTSTSENDELTPRALRALKRQRLALDSDGLLLPHIETHHRRKRRKENDNAAISNVAHANVGEVRRRMRQVRVRPRAQNVPKPRHIPPLAPTILDLPIQPVTTQESLRDVLTDQPSILAPKDDDSPKPLESESGTEQSSPKPSPKPSPKSLDLDSLIPLDPLPEFPPHDPPYTNSTDFQSNPTFTSEFPPATDLNPFSSNTLPFGSSQPPTFTNPGPFGSNPFPSNPTSFSTGFSHEFIPTQSQPDFSPSQDNAFSNTPGNPFPTQEYTNGYNNQPNGYPQQGTFSQPNSYDYTPAPHRDREVNIWKLACQERVEFLLRRYGIDTIKALVASEARARFPSPSTHPSNTRFRLYTPASYLERASYTYKSAEFEAMDFDMDDEEDEDDDLDECDLGGEYDEDYDDDEEDADGEGLFLMDVEGTKGIVTPCVPAIVTPTVPSVPSILQPVPSIAPTPQKQATSPPRSTSPPALGGRSLLDTMPSRPMCTSPPCSPPRRTPSPPLTPQRLSAPTTPPSTPVSIHQTPSTPTPPSTPPSVPSHPTPALTPTPQTPPPIHSPQTPPSTPPQIHHPTLPRTPPLSSLHVTLLSEPPRAFMGRGTPPDRRRLSEWGRWGCVQVYGKGGERRRLSLGHGGEQHMHLHHGQPMQCGESLNMNMGMEQLLKDDMSRHGDNAAAQPQHGEHPPLQLEHQAPHEHPHPHQPPHEEPHPHPNPHDEPPHTHTHTHSVPGEWTSFLFAMLEGDGTGSAGWYELGAQGAQGGGEGMGGVPQSMGVLGGAQMGAQSLGIGIGGAQDLGGQGMGGLGIGMGGQGMGASQPVSIGEADSTLRFALG